VAKGIADGFDRLASLPASRGSPQYLMPAGPGGSLREARGRQDAKYDVEKMKDNSEPEEDRGVETDYSAEEAEQMGAMPRSKCGTNIELR
jgi:hypothetical protein